MLQLRVHSYTNNQRVIMKKLSLILCVFSLTLVSAQFPDFSNLGASIENKVRESLAPLENLGEKIQHDIQSGFSHFQNGDFGSRIAQEVEKNLLPVRAMAMRLEMMDGIGGQTVIKYPNGKVLLAQDGVLYECSGPISDNGKCEGSLSVLDLNKKENFCFRRAHVKVNNFYCFGSGNGISMTDINGKITCKSNDNSPTLVISEEDYQKMCQNVGGPAIYSYTPNEQNPSSIRIPNDNPYLKCQNNSPKVCVFN